MEHWDGSRWSLLPPIKAPSGQNVAAGVISLGPTEGWALCSFLDTQGNAHSCAAHLAGSRWTAFTQRPVSEGGYVDVADVSGSEAFAVGYGYSPTLTMQVPLVLRWNGSVWAKFALGLNGALFGVSADTASDVWIVGLYGTSHGYQMLVMHWDGTRWNIIKPPDRGFADSELRDVVAFSPTDVWAIGDERITPNSDYTPLIEHWDGSTWTKSTGLAATESVVLGTVAGHSSTDLWVVRDGIQSNTSTVEHWDGTAWTVQPLPTPDRTDQLAVFDLAAISGGGAWASGWYVPSGGQHLQHPLMEYHP
jgi:hypothetical protein